MSKKLKLALVGGGMFGRDVVLRSLADVERCGIAPYLGTVGLDLSARQLGGVEYEVAAVGTRTEKTARGLIGDYEKWLGREAMSRRGGALPTAHFGEAPWVEILDRCKPDVLFVATPDHLHTAPILAAIERGVHVVAEKPLALSLAETKTIVERSKAASTVVAVDMHKRYDSFLRYTFTDVTPRLGDLLYGRAVLEEPLEVSTQIFKWAESSNPFSYVGVHWTDLFGYYLGVTPVSLQAVGQKKLLASWRDAAHPAGIDTFDSMQVTVQYDNGMSVQYVNAWINPAEFEGAVNQEMEIVGSKGRVFVDQQSRGLRYTITGDGTRTRNPHFQAEVPRLQALSGKGSVLADPGRQDASCIGYCKDSLIAGLDAASRVALGLVKRSELVGKYPDAESAVSLVAILEAAAEVAQRNLAHLAAGRGAPVSAIFQGSEFGIVDPAT